MPSVLMHGNKADPPDRSAGSSTGLPLVLPFLVGTAFGGVVGALLAVGAGVMSRRLLNSPAASAGSTPAGELPRFEILLQ